MATKDHHEAVNKTEINVETTIEQSTSGSNERVNELTADLQRLQADFANFMRRSDQEKGELLTFTISRVMRDLLPVRDNFDRELANRPTSIDATWAASIDSIRTQFDSVMKGLRVERFDSVGYGFDAHFHEAVSDEGGEGSHEVVIEELQPGYKLEDKVIRHAIVKVGRSDDALQYDSLQQKVHDSIKNEGEK